VNKNILNCKQQCNLSYGQGLISHDYTSDVYFTVFAFNVAPA
jgi:hypothetical protein